MFVPVDLGVVFFGGADALALDVESGELLVAAAGADADGEVCADEAGDAASGIGGGGSALCAGCVMGAAEEAAFS